MTLIIHKHMLIGKLARSNDKRLLFQAQAGQLLLKPARLLLFCQLHATSAYLHSS